MATQKTAPSASAQRYQKLLQRVGQLNLDQGGFFRPPVGISSLRVLPPVGGMGDVFFKEVGIHYVTDKDMFTCPQISAGQPCPICEVNQALYEAGEKDAAKKYRASRAFYMNVIDRKNEGNGPMIWTPGISILQAIVALINDPDYGDISDMEAGFDLKVERTGEGKDNTKYMIRAARNATPLSNDADKAQEWLDASKDLEEYVADKLMSYEDLAKKSGVDVFMVDEEDDPEPEPAPRIAKPQSRTLAGAPARVAKASVDTAPPESAEGDDEDEDDTPPSRPTASQAIGARLNQRRTGPLKR